MPKTYRKKQLPSVKIRINYPQESRKCVLCGSKLKQKSTATRNLTNLKHKAALSVQVCGCINVDCPNTYARLRPVSYLNQIVPESGYGIDVYGLIAYLRFTNRLTIREITDYIGTHYPHVEVLERQIDNIIKHISLCISQSGKNAEHLKHYFSQRNQSTLQLSIDGVAPEQGHNILYIVREVISGKILFAHYSTHSDAESITNEILLPLKNLLSSADLSIGGWIADKELALSKAIVDVFPLVPFQHCQSHFLAAMKKPLTQSDTDLGKRIKKTLVSFEK